MNIRKKKVGLALGSGAARGLAHIGVIKVLEENRIPISMIAGTSMGALVGALYAAGFSGNDLKEIACNVNFRTIAKLFVPTFPVTGLVDGKRIEEFLHALVSDVNISSLKMPFAAIAADIESAEEVVVKDGSLIGAIRASISIPGIFTPVKHQDRFLVDGGLLNPVPVDVVRNMGADFVIAVNVPYSLKTKSVDMIIDSSHGNTDTVQIANSNKINKMLTMFLNKKSNLSQSRSGLSKILKGVYEHKGQKKLNIFKIIMTTINIMENQIKDLQLLYHKPDLLIEPQVDIASTFDFYKAREIIEIGEKETIKELKKILK